MWWIYGKSLLFNWNVTISFYFYWTAQNWLSAISIPLAHQRDEMEMVFVWQKGAELRQFEVKKKLFQIDCVTWPETVAAFK